MTALFRGRGLTAQERTWLAWAFGALGPDRVRRGLEAQGRGWGECFLSHAITDAGGPPASWRGAGWKDARWRAATEIGCAPWIVDEIARLWDNREDLVRAFAAEWLEAGRGRS